MSEMIIQPDELRHAAEEFTRAGKDLEKVLKNLDDTTGNLKEHWRAASQQVFYKQFNEMRQYMEGMKILLDHISLEMQSMAEHFEEADK